MLIHCPIKPSELLIIPSVHKQIMSVCPSVESHTFRPTVSCTGIRVLKPAKSINVCTCLSEWHYIVICVGLYASRLLILNITGHCVKSVMVEHKSYVLSRLSLCRKENFLLINNLSQYTFTTYKGWIKSSGNSSIVLK